MSYSKDYPSDKPTVREAYRAPDGPPPSYYQQPGSSTNPFRNSPSPSRGFVSPPSGYDNSQPYVGREASQYYSYEQQAGPPQTSSSSYLAPPYPPPANDQRSPSPSGGSSSSRAGGFMKGLTGSGPEDVLNPPPPSFTRAPQGQLPYSPFPPCVAISIGKGLNSGFPMLPPPTQVQPHPFMTHDVNEEDWTRFLGDLKKIGTLSPMNKIVANVAPMAMGVGLLGGLFITRALQNGMERKKSGPATDLVNHWNNYFFHPRMMEVTLVHGHIIYNGSGNVPPDMAQHGYRRRRDSDSDSSSSSDSEDDHHHRHGVSSHTSVLSSREQRRADKRARRDERREDKRERKDERRARKRERREKKRGEKSVKDEPWKVIISYRPPMRG